MAQPLPSSGRVNANFNAAITRVGLDGTYTIQHLRPGDYTVVALLPGYISPFDDLQLDRNTDSVGISDSELRTRLARNGVVSVRNNETVHFDVTLKRGAAISGRVLYDDGAPATQVVICLEDVNSRSSAPKSPQQGNNEEEMPGGDAGALMRSFFLHQSQGTDDEGNFRISGVKPGTYRIAALPATGESLQPDETETFIFGGIGNPRALRIYSGDTLHKNAAKTYQLRAGDEVSDVDITIPVYVFHRVEGQLITVDGRPLFSASLSLTDSSDGSLVLRAQLARDGSFVFPEVPSGTYKLAIMDARSGTLPDNFSDNFPDAAPVPSSMLQNAQSFSDKTTIVLVKDVDVTDLTVQLQGAQPAANQRAVASSSTQ